MSFEVRRLSGSLGAEVRGVALAEVDAAAAEEIRRLLLEQRVQLVIILGELLALDRLLHGGELAVGQEPRGGIPPASPDDG